MVNSKCKMRIIMRHRKIQLAGILDNSSYGVSFGESTVILDGSVERKIRDMLIGSPFSKCIQGDPKKGNCVFLVYAYNKDPKKDVLIARYEFFKQGNNRFLNSSVNPTKLISGENDIPVILKEVDVRFVIEEKNEAFNTFKYLNRLPYLLLEKLPSDKPFVWTREYLSKIRMGDINISRFQMAWYSADLGKERDAVFWYLRSCYSGSFGSFVNRKFENLASALNIASKLHDNHGGNFTLEKKYGKNRNKLFSLTVYAKNDDPNYKSKRYDYKVANKLRFDCTFTNLFLGNKGIKTIGDLEEIYKKKCEKEGYDVGFVRWLREEVITAVCMDYVLNLSSDTYKEMLNKCEDVVGKAEKALVKYWLNSENSLLGLSNIEIAKEVGIPASNISKQMINVFNETGIDLTIPRAYHTGMLFNRIAHHMTTEEMDAYVLKKKHNQRVNFDELIERDIEELDKVRRALDTSSCLKTQKFIPEEVSLKDMWFLSKLTKKYEKIFYSRKHSNIMKQKEKERYEESMFEY